jgi:hypothetical protein
MAALEVLDEGFRTASNLGLTKPDIAMLFGHFYSLQGRVSRICCWMLASLFVVAS